MLNIIIKAVFWIVSKIADLILLPIMAIINAIIPNFSVAIGGIFDFLQMGFNYIPFFLKSLLIPSFCIEFVYLVFTTYISLIIGVRVYNFILRCYYLFKL